MEKTLIIANWKENFTMDEARKWVDVFNNNFSSLRSERFASGESNTIQQFNKVVICPSFVLLPTMASEISKLEGVELGAQDVSKFEEGQYTGEVSAKMLKDFVSYVIAGHSERRKHFGETDEDIALKIEHCLKHELTPIVCVNKIEQASTDKAIFAYEPLFAVGTGIPDSPENAQEFAEKIKSVVGQDVRVLYGGSVTSENVKSFVSQPDINGVLVGQASLDPKEFARICNEVC